MAFPTDAEINDLHNEPSGQTYIYRGGGRWDAYVNSQPGHLLNYYTKAQVDALQLAQDGNITAASNAAIAAQETADAAIPATEKGANEGVATLDETGKVPSEQIPTLAAADISFTPAGDLSATDVQAALEELDDEKQPLSENLTAWAEIDPETKADAASVGTGVPNGGTEGQVLVKQSNDDGDADWETPERMPAGAIQDFARSTAPTGWLKCNGAAVLRASYSDLATAIYCGDIHNPTALFGYRATTNINPSSNRSTSGDYIVLPDFRGEFRRGWDDGRGTDAGRLFGTAQADELKSHDHTASTSVTLTNGGNNVRQATTNQFYLQDSEISAPYRVDTITASATTTVNSTGGTETRPRNIAVLTCIKY